MLPVKDRTSDGSARVTLDKLSARKRNGHSAPPITQPSSARYDDQSWSAHAGVGRRAQSAHVHDPAGSSNQGQPRQPKGAPARGLYPEPISLLRSYNCTYLLNIMEQNKHIMEGTTTYQTAKNYNVGSEHFRVSLCRPTMGKESVKFRLTQEPMCLERYRTDGKYRISWTQSLTYSDNSSTTKSTSDPAIC